MRRSWGKSFNVSKQIASLTPRCRRSRVCRFTFRAGVACVEFAAIAPVLVLITLCIIDTCNVIHLKQKINTVAFETVRVASFNDETFESARSKGLVFARARGLNGAVVVVESFDAGRFPTRASLPLGFTLRAQVSIPIQGNIPGPFVLFRNTNIQSQLVRMSAR